MDDQLRGLLRKYYSAPTDILAHEIIGSLTRIIAPDVETLPITVTLPGWEEPTVYGVPKNLTCPDCLHEMWVDMEQTETLRPDQNDIYDCVGLFRLTYVCDCASFNKTCDCRAVEVKIVYSTSKCEWCGEAAATRISGYGLALGPGAALCDSCDPS